MRNFKRVPAIFCITAVSAFFSIHAIGQIFQPGDANKRTTVTFSAPVEIPGVHLKGYATLPAGTYVFKLVDSQVNRHIVQISNADESVTYATILAIPNTRLKRTDSTVITFRERPNGEPPALRAWFYPDATWGDEFVYPKGKAKQIAQATDTPVLYNNEETATEVTEPIQPPTQPAISAMNASPVMAYNPAGDEVDLSQVVSAPQTDNLQASNVEPQAPAQPEPTPVAQTEPAPTVASTSTSQPDQLPQTASPLGLLMLGGLLSLGGAVAIGQMRRLHS